MRQNKRRAVLYLLLHLSTLLPLSNCLNFNFSSFDQNSPLQYDESDATVNGTEINLTRYPMQYATGRVVHSEPLLLWDARTGALTDFATQFAFVINSYNKTEYADGLAFFLSPYDNGSKLPYSRGGFLGLFSNSSLSNITVDTVAVEFDTFSNDWDPKGVHLGIDVKSIESKVTRPWNASIRDGRRAIAWVNYNSTTHNLSVLVNYDSDPALASASLSYIVDLRQELPEKVAIGFSATTGNLTETHALLSWSFISSLQSSADRKKSMAGVAVGGTIGAIILVSVAVILIWYLVSRKKAASDTVIDDDPIDDRFARETGPKRFHYEELAAASRDFSEEGKLGEGGFGSVYKGKLNELDVAIKRVSKDGKQGRKEYIAEVTIISRLRHRNLVQLIGWCHDRGEFLLVYEYMPNGSLDTHLYSSAKCLSWPARHKATLGLASALFYLHHECEPSVVHRDVKPSNVMLDSAFNAKLGDFGLARLVDDGLGLQTTILAGTVPYMAPEYYHYGKASNESDVYSFGIVVLEIACGRRPMEGGLLVEWVWELYGRGQVLEAADKRLGREFDETEMERLLVVGLWCAHPDCKNRPSIQQAINVLNFEKPMPSLPPRRPTPIYHSPSFDMLASGSSGFVTASMSASTGCSVEMNLTTTICSVTPATTTTLSPGRSCVNCSADQKWPA